MDRFKFEQLISDETGSWLKDAKRRQRRKIIAWVTLYPRIWYYTLKRRCINWIIDKHLK